MKIPHTQIHIALFSMLMLLVPAHFWHSGYIGWQFEIGFESGFAGMLPFEQAMLIPITQTAAYPNALYVGGFLTLLLLLLCWKRMAWQTVLLMCFLSVSGTQITKTALKQITQEPRPYVVYINENTFPFMGYEAHSFYRQPEHIQNQAIKESFPRMITDYMLTEDKGFSFPSGHTIFVVSWLLLFVGLLPRWSKAVLLPILAIWAMAVAYSRVRLGMHYPIDLLASILLSWAWHGFLFGHVLPQLQMYFPHQNAAKQVSRLSGSLKRD